MTTLVLLCLCAHFFWYSMSDSGNAVGCGQAWTKYHHNITSPFGHLHLVHFINFCSSCTVVRFLQRVFCCGVARSCGSLPPSFTVSVTIANLKYQYVDCERWSEKDITQSKNPGGGRNVASSVPEVCVNGVSINLSFVCALQLVYECWCRH